jgi:hypothetical protein
MLVNWPRRRRLGGLARLAHRRIAVVRVGLLLVLAMCGLPHTAVGQSWAEAYTARDYARAAELLQPIVIEQVQALGTGPDSDPAPARYLAVLYARGSGVSRDPVLACALARLSDMVRQQVRVPQFKDAQEAFAYKAILDESEQFVRAHCEALTNRQQLAAGRSLGCFAFGLREGTLTIGEQTIWVDRLGLRLSESAADPPASDLWCSQVVARLEPRTIVPPADAAPGVVARPFVELLAWQGMQMAGDHSIRYVLTWTMFELRGKKLEPAAVEHLLSVATLPRAALPSDFDARFSVEMIRSGHIRWRLDGAPPKRGWIMLAEGESR